MTATVLELHPRDEITSSPSRADQETSATGDDGVFDGGMLNHADISVNTQGTDYRVSRIPEITNQVSAPASVEETMANQQTEKNYFDDFLKAKFEHIDYIFGQIREDVHSLKSEFSEVKADNKATRKTVIATGVSVVLSLLAIIGGMIYATAQINTAWLTALAQIFKNQ